MNKLDFSIYEESKSYFSLFDILIKQIASNKDEFLLQQNISPTSYRRAKTSEQKVGLDIVMKLSEYFGFRLTSKEEIRRIDKICKKIYSELYYKIFDKFDCYIKIVDEELEKNHLLFPIFKLFKLFLNLNSTQEREKVIYENLKLFNEVKEYECFYTEELKELFVAIKIVFLESIPNRVLMGDYKDGLIYYSIASRMNREKKYLESLYFAKKAERIFLKENNFFRIFYLNNIISFNYNALENYQKSYLIEHNQLLSLAAFHNEEFEFFATRLHLSVACIGLKKYKELLELFDCNCKFDSTELYCFLIALYYENIKEYNLFLDKINRQAISAHMRVIIDNIDSFLHKKDKNILMKLEKSNIHIPLLIILKKMFYE